MLTSGRPRVRNLRTRTVPVVVYCARDLLCSRRSTVCQHGWHVENGIPKTSAKDKKGKAKTDRDTHTQPYSRTGVVKLYW